MWQAECAIDFHDNDGHLMMIAAGVSYKGQVELTRVFWRRASPTEPKWPR